MARIEPIPPQQWPAEMVAAIASLATPQSRAEPPGRDDRPKGMNILGTFAHHPALAAAWFGFNAHLLVRSTLTARQRELLILRVATVRDAQYEWAQHVVLGRDAGLSDDEIERIGEGSHPDDASWNNLEAALLRAVDELVGDGAIGGATWEVLADELEVEQLFDVIFTVGGYETLAFLMRSVDLELDDDLRPR